MFELFWALICTDAVRILLKASAVSYTEYHIDYEQEKTANFIISVALHSLELSLSKFIESTKGADSSCLNNISAKFARVGILGI